jgi:hypothetical protein
MMDSTRRNFKATTSKPAPVQLGFVPNAKTPVKPHAKTRHKTSKQRALPYFEQFMITLRRCYKNNAPKYLQDAVRYMRQHYLEYPALAIIILSILIPVLGPTLQKDRYLLTGAASLLSKTPASLQKDVSFDGKAAAYTFVPAETQQQANTQTAGGAKYSASLGLDARDGIALTDTSNKLKISLTPKFDTQQAKQVDGHIVYPVGGADSQLVYTFRGNGLKEDIVLYSNPSDVASYAYNLKLPSALEARQMPDGSIGIYGGDSVLYGDISYGSDKDKSIVESAQAHSKKTTLLYVIPAPVIKESNGKSVAKAQFHFDQKTSTLTILVSALRQASYPLTIDPSLALASASDFAQGNSDSNIDIDTTNNTVSRGAITGGSIASTAVNTSNFSYSVYDLGAAVWNNVVYMVGGNKGANAANTGNLGTVNTVQQATINTTTHALGSFTTSANVLPALTSNSRVIAYNGYLYSIGGNSGGRTAAVYYSKIKSDGTLGTWGTPGTGGTLPAANFQFGVAVYNGYIYEVGGWTAASQGTTTSNYAKINGDGTLGAWTATTSLAAGRYGNVVTQYNGYIYTYGGAMPGCCSSTGEYAKINADGTLGTWSALAYGLVNSAGASRGLDYEQGAAYKGYLYAQGGCTAQDAAGSCTTTITNDLQYAPIYADGSIGPWKAYGLSNTAIRTAGTLLFSDNYAYLLDGCNEDISNGGQGNPCKNGKLVPNAQYLKVDPAGITYGPSTADQSMTTARWAAATAVYNGHVYVVGGCTSTGTNGTLDKCTSTAGTVESASINTDGSLSTWSTTGMTAEATPRWGHKLNAYNGWLYITGGCTPAAVTSACLQQSVTERIQLTSSGAMTGSWTAGTSLNTARSLQFTAIVNGYMYVIGGYTATYGSSGLKTVERSTIGSNGTLGSWSALSADLPNDRKGTEQAAVWNNTIYIVAGEQDTGGGTNTIYYNPVDSSGNLNSTWTTNSIVTPTNNGVYGSTFINKGIMYVTASDTPHLAPLAADGSVGAFTQASSPTSVVAAVGTAFMANDTVHVAGGCNSFTAPTCNSVAPNSANVYWPLNNGGTGQPGTSATTTVLPNAQFATMGAAANGYVYAIGGATHAVSTVAIANVYYSKIGNDGTLGAWQSTASLNTPRFGAGVTIYDGYVYVLGGNNGSALNTGEFAKLNSDGTVGAWSQVTLNDSRVIPAAFALNGYLYISGGTTNGTTPIGTTLYAPIGANGLPGSWSTTSASFANARFGLQAFSANGYVYILGGYDGTKFYNDVQYTKPSSSTGDISSWSFGNAFPIGREEFSSVVSNGYLYVYSGGNGTVLTDIESAPILSNGALGDWSSAGNITGTPEYWGGSASSNGKLYLLGGTPDSVNASSTVNYVPLRSQPRIARYTKLFTTDKDVTPVNFESNFITNNTRLPFTYLSGKIATPALSAGTTYSSISDTKTAIDTTQGAYHSFNFVFDDSSNATFPDNLSNPTTVSSFLFNYHPSTTQRLRGGGTFNSGLNQSLDAP